MLMLIVATVVLPTFYFPSAKAADEQSWTSMNSMLTARGGLGVAVANGKIFAIGGLNGGLPLNTNEQFDPNTNQWTSKAPLPTARSGFSIVAYQNKIYVIGGTVGNGYVGNNEVYDPMTNSWETKASMPTPRADFSANVVDDKIYLIGGKRYSSIEPYFKETDVNEVYDPANNSWSTAKATPNAVYGYGSAVIDDKIHVIGGSKTPLSLGNSVFVDSNQVYDPQNNNWTVAASAPNLVTYGATAVTTNYMAPLRLYFIGGFSSSAYISNTQVYDPSKNSWTNGASMPTARAYLGVAIINDVLYAIGGFDGKNWLNTVEQYKPIGYGTVPPQIQITSPENKTYSDVSLSYDINKGVQWTGYSLDSQANVTIKQTTGLFNLSQGSHNVVIYANDSAGNMGQSSQVFFSVDTVPPNIVIMIPLNQSYGSTDIQLTFKVNEETTQLAYSLDDDAKVPIAGNVSLPALTNGSHRLTLYATDEIGNPGSKTVYFSISPFPTVMLAAIIAIVVIAVAAGYLFVKRRKVGGNQAIVTSAKSLDKEADSEI
jgi:N-acetylneuraminic acid mutarotase